MRRSMKAFIQLVLEVPGQHGFPMAVQPEHDRQTSMIAQNLPQ